MKPSKTISLAQIYIVIIWILAISILVGGCVSPDNDPTTIPTTEPTTIPTTHTTEPPTTVPTEPPHNWEAGFVSSLALSVDYYDADGMLLGTLPRGTLVEYEITGDGTLQLLVDGVIGYLPEHATIVTDYADIIPLHTQYVRTAVNLRNIEGMLLTAFADKGVAVEIIGFDYLEADGQPHMYQVKLEDEEGYIMPWYLADSEENALANFDDGNYHFHQRREDKYGGGGAANLDYYPREKSPIEGNIMPEECRTLYIASWQLKELDSYLEIADGSGINAFVVDIVDGESIGYASHVMNQYSPTGAAKALNSVEEYQAAIQRIKDAGYYVIGRITAFKDTYYIKDHPEHAITDAKGKALKLTGAYWPTAFSRDAWQYKVDLAVEAVELMGFNEIQFDYVRFPDNTRSYEKKNNIDFRNTYGETKAQAIQRFLMYAVDILHEHGAYVSADVYGESAYTYVTAYGQYWPAISNVVDVISGMPYPDHFSANGSWLPWEHPYDTLYNWGECVMYRQSETATPAVVRTWIQAYNAIREPYTKYRVKEVSAQIQALRDVGCTGGYMTWNGSSSISKYKQLIPAFAPPEEE